VAVLPATVNPAAAPRALFVVKTVVGYYTIGVVKIESKRT
jgi:hypothetical protein